MRTLFLSAMVVSAVLAGCASEAPLRTALPPLESYVPPLVQPPLPDPLTAEDTDLAPPPPPRPAYLYTRTDEDLRLAYADGLASLLNAPATPAQARRVPITEVRSWLGFLQAVNPRAAAFTRGTLGPVLEESALVAYAVPASNPASCARMSETLFVGVPERYQTGNRPFVGLIVRDACEDGAPCLRCTGVGGAVIDGQRPRVCVVAACGR